MHRLTGVYSVAEKQLAKGARALQKFAAPLSPQEAIQEARGDLEEAARTLRGQARHHRLALWLQQLDKSETGSRSGRPLVVAEPASPTSSEETDSEWQQLSTLPVASKRISHEGGPSTSDLNKPTWLTTSVPGFRNLFLRSQAFHLLIEGYAAEPPSSEEEARLLLQLIATCCDNCPQSEELFSALERVSQTCKQCIKEGVDSEALHSVANCAADAVQSLQTPAEVEEADNKIELLREEVAEQAAMAALLHKFNHGEQQPAKEVTRKKLTQGLTATNEILLLVEALCRLAEGKVKLLASCQPAPFGKLEEQLQQRSTLLASTCSIADIEMSENLRQQNESTQFRERKTSDLDSSIEAVQEEIKELQTERAALLAKLEQVELSLAKAHARKADAEEGKNIFEEGSNFTIQALSQQADQLYKQRRQCQSETSALAACRQLVKQAETAQSAQRKASKEQAVDTVLAAAGEYTHAATRHLYFLRAILQLLLQQLTFCSSELQESESRQTRAISLGMDHVLADVSLQRHRLMQQYLEIEAAYIKHLEEVESVYEKTHRMNQRALEFQPSQREVKDHGSVHLGTETVEVFESIGKLKEAFEVLKRPESLPPRGNSLPDFEEIQSHIEVEGSSVQHLADGSKVVHLAASRKSVSRDLDPPDTASKLVEESNEDCKKEHPTAESENAVEASSIDKPLADEHGQSDRVASRHMHTKD